MYVDTTTSENNTNVKANIINDYLVPRFEAALGRYRLQTTEKAYSMHVIKTRNVYGRSIRKPCIISNHAVLESLRLSSGRLAARNLSTHCRKNRTKISKSRAKKELSNGIKIGNSVFYAGCPIFSYTVIYGGYNKQGDKTEMNGCRVP